MEKQGLTQLEVPIEFLVGRVFTSTIVDESTGEIIVNANMKTAESLNSLCEAGIGEFNTLYISELDHGSYISDTIRIDSSTNRLEALVEMPV